MKVRFAPEFYTLAWYSQDTIFEVLSSYEIDQDWNGTFYNLLHPNGTILSDVEGWKLERA